MASLPPPHAPPLPPHCTQAQSPASSHPLIPGRIISAPAAARCCRHMPPPLTPTHTTTTTLDLDTELSKQSITYSLGSRLVVKPPEAASSCRHRLAAGILAGRHHLLPPPGPPPPPPAIKQVQQATSSHSRIHLSPGLSSGRQRPRAAAGSRTGSRAGGSSARSSRSLSQRSARSRSAAGKRREKFWTGQHKLNDVPATTHTGPMLGPLNLLATHPRSKAVDCCGAA
jgi:hypothetical protein